MVSKSQEEAFYNKPHKLKENNIKQGARSLSLHRTFLRLPQSVAAHSCRHGGLGRGRGRRAHCLAQQVELCFLGVGWSLSGIPVTAMPDPTWRWEG